MKVLKPAKSIRGCVKFGTLCLFSLSIPTIAQISSLPPEVTKICSIQFEKDTRRPAKVEDAALPCLLEAAKRLRGQPDIKLVLVGVADLVKDYAADANGHMRKTEDRTGYDVRLEDLAAYRALNTKWYLTRWLKIAPEKILPTTNESIQGQYVTIYQVPATADFNHNYVGTTKTNENPCTVKPCYTPDEENLTAQPRTRIPDTSTDSIRQ